MKCLNCGNEIEENAKFCARCGSPVNNLMDTGVNQSGTGIGSNNMFENNDFSTNNQLNTNNVMNNNGSDSSILFDNQVNSNANLYQVPNNNFNQGNMIVPNNNGTNNEITPEPQKNNKGIIILLILVLVAIIGVGGFFVFKSFRSDKTKVDLNSIFDPNKPIIVKNNGKYGYITSEGKIMIEPQYINANAFFDDYEPRKASITKPSKFSLPGATYLENFFYENVIDIVQNSERYESLGIGFPSPIILYGKPGTGKTYAVEKLAEFLDWPVYSINSSSIGSPYIHQTGQKIAEVFNKAFDTSPSIVIIDEMEAYLSKRDGAQDFKVEEIGEFLRLIPEAPKNKVLVVGMTNLIDNIDPAILRTGRFDHKIEVRMPTAEDIKSMLDTALSKLPKEDNLNLEKVIEALTDKPRSDVAFVVKEAARLTAFRGKDKISQQEIDDALEAKALKSATDKPKRRIGFNNDN